MLASAVKSGYAEASIAKQRGLSIGRIAPFLLFGCCNYPDILFWGEQT